MTVRRMPGGWASLVQYWFHLIEWLCGGISRNQAVPACILSAVVTWWVACLTSTWIPGRSLTRFMSVICQEEALEKHVWASHMISNVGTQNADY